MSLLTRCPRITTVLRFLWKSCLGSEHSALDSIIVAKKEKHQTLISLSLSKSLCLSISLSPPFSLSLSLFSVLGLSFNKYLVLLVSGLTRLVIPTLLELISSLGYWLYTRGPQPFEQSGAPFLKAAIVWLYFDFFPGWSNLVIV